jgi:hypothetical protein
VEEVHSWALLGSGIRRIEGVDWPSRFGDALRVLDPPGTLSVCRSWTRAEKVDWVAMTRLSVRGGLCEMTAEEKLLLCEIDLSGLEELPRAFSLNGCPFLERARLPVTVETLADGFWPVCAARGREFG